MAGYLVLLVAATVQVVLFSTLCHTDELVRLPFYQDKLHEETVFRRFIEILVKVRRDALDRSSAVSDFCIGSSK